MSTTSTNYSFGGVATTATTLGMAGLLLLGGAAGAPAMAADTAPAGEVSAAVAGSSGSAGQVVLHAPSAATTGDSIALQGKVKKNHHHKTRVVIQKKHGKKWQKVEATKTNKKGKFHTADAFGKKHKVSLRAKATGHGFSNTQTVTFTKASNGGGTSDGGGITPPPNNGGGTGDGGGTLPPNHGGGTGDGGDVTPPSDPMQVFVPEGDTQALLSAIDQAPSGATLHLTGTYYVSDTVDAVGWKAGVIINKDLTLSGGTLQSDGNDNVISVHQGAVLTLDGGINVTGGYAGTGAGVYSEGGLIINNAQIHDNHGLGLEDQWSRGAGVYINAENGSARTAWVKMYGGSIYNNTDVFRGGGLSNNGGYVEIDGGWVNNNQAATGGGLFNDNSGEVYVYGGGFKGNQIPDGTHQSGYSIFSNATRFYVYDHWVVGGAVDTDLPA